MSSELRNSELTFHPGFTDIDFLLLASIIHDANTMSCTERYKILCFQSRCIGLRNLGNI